MFIRTNESRNQPLHADRNVTPEQGQLSVRTMFVGTLAIVSKRKHCTSDMNVAVCVDTQQAVALH